MLSSREFAVSMEIVAAVRSAVEDEIDLLIEGHSPFSPATAVQVAKALEPFRPMWFEEPLPRPCLGKLHWTRRAFREDFAGNESVADG
jgi:galactonate dehydratase